MSSKPTHITEATIQAALDPKLSVDESVNALLEAGEISSGQAVALLDGGPYDLDGLRGIAKGPSNGRSGFVDVELPNKMVVPFPANLLLPV